MRVACDTGRRIEARWLALGGGVGDGEASGVVYGRLCLREISPAVCCVVWLWCSFGRRGVSLASITLGRFVLLVRLLAAALSRVAVAKRRVQFNSIQFALPGAPQALGASRTNHSFGRFAPVSHFWGASRHLAPFSHHCDVVFRGYWPNTEKLPTVSPQHQPRGTAIPGNFLRPGRPTNENR